MVSLQTSMCHGGTPWFRATHPWVLPMVSPFVAIARLAPPHPKSAYSQKELVHLTNLVLTPLKCNSSACSSGSLISRYTWNSTASCIALQGESRTLARISRGRIVGQNPWSRATCSAPKDICRTARGSLHPLIWSMVRWQGSKPLRKLLGTYSSALTPYLELPHSSP